MDENGASLTGPGSREPNPSVSAASGSGCSVSEEQIERIAQAFYEHPSWGHKQPWKSNPWARKAWIAAVTGVLCVQHPSDVPLADLAMMREEALRHAAEEKAMEMYAALRVAEDRMQRAIKWGVPGIEAGLALVRSLLTLIEGKSQ